MSQPTVSFLTIIEPKVRLAKKKKAIKNAALDWAEANTHVDHATDITLKIGTDHVAKASYNGQTNNIEIQDFHKA